MQELKEKIEQKEAENAELHEALAEKDAEIARLKALLENKQINTTAQNSACPGRNPCPVRRFCYFIGYPFAASITFPSSCIAFG